MISAEFALFGFDRQTWGRLSALLLGTPETPDAARALLVLFVDTDGAPQAAFHSIDGAIELDPEAARDLPRLCETQRARACFVMNALPGTELDALLSEPAQHDEDYEPGAMRLLRLLEHAGSGGLRRMWPNPFMNFATPLPAASGAALDLILPPDHCVLLAVFEGTEIWTAAVLHRGAQLDVLAGPTALREWTGPLGGDWRRDQRVLLQAVERELGSVHLAGFMARSTAERLFAGSDRGSWALAYATKEIIMTPMPPYAAAALALDGLAGMTQGFKGLFHGLEKEELQGIAQGFWRGLTDNRGLKGLLDFQSERPFSKRPESPPLKDEK